MPIKQTTKKQKKQSFDLLLIPYILITLAIILFGAKMYIYEYRVNQAMPEDTYQAVFLTNGQVYFGHLKTLNRSVYQLTDVYYLKQGQTANTTADTQADTQFSVVSLGEEIHQPTQSIYINQDQMLFWENLQTNSRILDAINQY
ncbi:hypothetical protein ACFL2M_00430 [Patescibacteria group bacterium]